MKGICSQCGVEKSLTVHGDCFKCHISGLGYGSKKKGCSNCDPDRFRISKNITTKRTTTPIE